MTLAALSAKPKGENLMGTTLFQSPSRIINGRGSFADLGNEVLRMGGKRVLIVTDPGIVAIGLAERTIKMLEADGLAVEIFSDVEPDPRCEITMEAAAKATEFKADTVIGLGGGSAIDVAKVAAVIATNGKDVRELMGTDKVEKPGLRTVHIPTTAGTGSEVTNIAILSDEIAKLKVGVVSPYLIAHTVLLDPELTIGLPQGGTAASGIDALIHAVEAYTSRYANALTDMYAEAAIRLIAPNLRKAWSRGDHVEAREAMLTGALYAGLSFTNAGVGAVHAFSYPIGATFHIPHGIANAVMLVPVLKKNVMSNLDRYAKIAEFMGEHIEGLNATEAAWKAVNAISSLCKDIQIPQHLRDFGVKESDVPELAKAVLQVTRLLNNNPRRITEQDAIEIYTEAL